MFDAVDDVTFASSRWRLRWRSGIENGALLGAGGFMFCVSAGAASLCRLIRATSAWPPRPAPQRTFQNHRLGPKGDMRELRHLILRGLV